MSQRNSGYDRRPHEQYDTPEWVTRELGTELSRKFGTQLVVWEPAEGAGKMVRVLAERWTTIGTDIQRGNDFLQTTTMLPRCNAIITNPPHSSALSEAFIRHALYLTEPVRGVVAMLLRVDYDSGRTRCDMFEDCQAWSKKIILRKRIVWFEPPPRPDGKKPAGPSENHAWYVWDWTHAGPATIVYAA